MSTDRGAGGTGRDPSIGKPSAKARTEADVAAYAELGLDARGETVFDAPAGSGRVHALMPSIATHTQPSGLSMLGAGVAPGLGGTPEDALPDEHVGRYEEQPRRKMPVFADPEHGRVRSAREVLVLHVYAGRRSGQVLEFETTAVVGRGAFGVVYRVASMSGGSQLCAIKKVPQDPHYKNRELVVMRQMSHVNVVGMHHYFYSREGETTFLNLVLEYVPQTLDRALSEAPLEPLRLKLYAYQLARGLSYLHMQSIAHRDVKPQNILVDPVSGVLKVCDLGCAKRLRAGAPSIAYICSRYYRAPELIFGATLYTTAIDVWSYGCVLAEMLLRAPLFPGCSAVDQLVQIIRVLGTPTLEETHAMNNQAHPQAFLPVRRRSWSSVLPAGTDAATIALIDSILCYSPQVRATMLEVCADPFFDDIRIAGLMLPPAGHGAAGAAPRPLPPLFDWTPDELRHARPELLPRLIPEHAWRNHPALLKLGVLERYPDYPSSMHDMGEAAMDPHE